MLVRFVAFLSSLLLRIVVNLMRFLLVALVLLLIVKVLQLICVVILILSVWIWLRICFALVSVVLVLVRPLFTLILILINLIVFGFMNNLQYLLTALRYLKLLSPLKVSELDYMRLGAIENLEELVLKLVVNNDFIVFCGKLSDDEK